MNNFLFYLILALHNLIWFEGFERQSNVKKVLWVVCWPLVLILLIAIWIAVLVFALVAVVPLSTYRQWQRRRSK